MAKFTRNCPKCNKELSYSTKYACKDAEKVNRQCIACSKTKDMPLTRNCPKCNKEIIHTNKHNCYEAKKAKRLCKECGYVGNKIKLGGENNPFYGKKHSQETKDKISNFQKNEREWKEEHKQQAREQLKKVSNSRPIYDIWVEKYGKEIADQKLKKLKEKHSKNNSGKNNGMFGKPPPKGSGNGWSGWYNGWYFRSLRELSYMINVIEKNNLDWKTPDFKIKYTDYKGTERSYFPDFIIGNKIIEIKPQRLINSPKVIAKKEAAEKFVKENNMEYEIIDPQILSDSEIKELYNDGKIRFLDRYEEKYKERYSDE